MPWRALSYLNQALEMRRSVLDPGSVQLRNSLESLAKLHLRRGELDNAQSYISEVLHMSEEHELVARIEEIRTLANEIAMAREHIPSP